MFFFSHQKSNKPPPPHLLTATPIPPPILSELSDLSEAERLEALVSSGLTHIQVRGGFIYG